VDVPQLPTAAPSGAEPTGAGLGGRAARKRQVPTQRRLPDRDHRVAGSAFFIATGPVVAKASRPLHTDCKIFACRFDPSDQRSNTKKSMPREETCARPGGFVERHRYFPALSGEVSMNSAIGVIVSALFCALVIAVLWLAIGAEEIHQRQIGQGSRLAARIRKKSAT
jgi:hypothetical protein